MPKRLKRRLLNIPSHSGPYFWLADNVLKIYTSKESHVPSELNEKENNCHWSLELNLSRIRGTENFTFWKYHKFERRRYSTVVDIEVRRSYERSRRGWVSQCLYSAGLPWSNLWSLVESEKFGNQESLSLFLLFSNGGAGSGVRVW